MGLKENMQTTLKDFLLAAKRQIDKWQSASTIHSLVHNTTKKGPRYPVIEFDDVPQYMSCVGDSSNLYVKYSKTEAMYVPSHVKWEVIFKTSIGYVKVVNRNEILWSIDKSKWGKIHLIGTYSRKYVVNELKVENDVYYAELVVETNPSVRHIEYYESLSGEIWKPRNK